MEAKQQKQRTRKDEVETGEKFKIIIIFSGFCFSVKGTVCILGT